MRLAGHRAFQFSIFIAVLITPIQRFAFAFVVNEYGLSPVSR